MIGRAAVALFLVGAAIAARASTWESPAFAAGTSRPARVVLLPAEASMVRTRLTDAMPFVKETKLMEDALRGEAGAKLAELGYEPDLDALSREAIAADRDVQAMVRELEESLSSIIDVAAGKPKDIGKGRFSVGDAVLPLASRTGADGFLWLQSQSVVPSKGQRTLGSIFSVLSCSYGVPSNQTQLVAVLLDARTGDLASVTTAVTGGPVLKDPQQVARHAVNEVFQQWPAFSVARRVSEKRLAAAATATKPQIALAAQDVDEHALIARFEDADARLQGKPVAGPPETVDARDEFTQDGRPGAANGATQATITSLFEPAPDDRAAPPAAAPAPVPQQEQPPQSQPPQSQLQEPRLQEPQQQLQEPQPQQQPPRPDARAAWEAARGGQPVALRQVVLQMVDGNPGIVVKNVTAEALLVSLDLAPWRALAAGEEAPFDSGAGSHGLLVASPEGAELARVTLLVGRRLARIEIRPSASGP